MPEQYVKNQHYIPQCLLTHFCNADGQLYEALVEEEQLYRTNHRSAMCENHTYEHEYLEKNSLEKYFGRIEEHMGPAIRRIIELIESYERNECDFSEIKKLVHKYMREFIIFYYRSGALLFEFEHQRKNRQDRIYLLLKNIMNSRYIKELSKTIINFYDIAIIKSEDNEFIMSDQYVSTVALRIKNRFFSVSNRHMGLKDVMILLPLSAKYYVAVTHGNSPSYIKDNRINTLSQSQIDEINEAIINNSYRKCVGFNDEAMRRTLPKFKYSSPSEIFAGNDDGVYMGATLKKEVFFYQHDKKSWNMFIRHNWMIYSKLNRNDKCACGSGLKFKKCCEKHYKVCKRMMDDIASERGDYPVSQYAVVEKPISEFHK